MDGLYAYVRGNILYEYATLYALFSSWTIFLYFQYGNFGPTLQSMLGSVITARDRWLKPGGLILPSVATVCSFSVNLTCGDNDLEIFCSWFESIA